MWEGLSMRLSHSLVPRPSLPAFLCCTQKKERGPGDKASYGGCYRIYFGDGFGDFIFSKLPFGATCSSLDLMLIHVKYIQQVDTLTTM